MDPNQERVFRDRRVGFAITDGSLCVTDVGGASDILTSGCAAWIGHSLLDLAPELVGSEGALQEILDGALPRLQIPWVNRDAPDGSTLYITLVDLPYYDEHGAITGLIHIVHDVTEIGALEQRLMQHRNTLRLLERTLREQNVQLLAANAELRRLDEAKSAFVSIAAHELRTPLTSISGYVEMLLDGDAGALNAQQSDYLEIVAASADRLLTLTRELLDVARLESGRLELLLQPTDLCALVARVIAEHRPQLDAREQHIELSAHETLPLALIDPGRAIQIIANLVSNASKFSPAGAQIRVSLALSGEAPGFLQVAVADDGPGIAAADRARLFRPFARGTAAQLSGAGGSGLGLYITKSLVELHGGQIVLESGPAGGTQVAVTLPTAVANVA